MTNLKKQKAYDITLWGLYLYVLLTWVQVFFSGKSIIEGLIWKTILAIPLLLFIPSIRAIAKNGVVWYSFVSLGYLTWLSSGLVMKFEVLRLLGFIALFVSFSASMMLSRWRNL